MGYYTKYNLNIKPYPSEKDEKKIIKFLSSRIYGDDGADIVDLADLLQEEMKWYDHGKNLKEVSLKYPKYLFILKGEGEESGDLWVHYYKNGKSQFCKAKIVFDEFDESKLE